MARRFILIPLEGVREGWFFGWLRNLLLLLMAGTVLAYLLGVPHVFVGRSGAAWYGSPVWTECRYLGPFGIIRAAPGDRGIPEDCAFFALIEWEHAVRMARQQGLR